MMKKAFEMAGEVLGTGALLAIVAAFVWLCCACSGVHWE